MSKHYSDALVILCGDDRYSPEKELHKGYEAVLAAEESHCHFKATAFGAALSVANPKHEEYWLDVLATAKHLGITRIIVINHLDCGAVKLAHPDITETEERQINIDLLKSACQFFAKHAPEMNFSGYLQDFDDFEKIC